LQAFEIDIVPDVTTRYSLTNNSFSVPHRFVVTDGFICGKPIVDTGFTGRTNSGWAENAPCCLTPNAFPGCTGTPNLECPIDPNVVTQPGGGTGAGTTASFVATTSKLYVIGFGVCAFTGKPAKRIYVRNEPTSHRIPQLTQISLLTTRAYFRPSPSNKQYSR